MIRTKQWSWRVVTVRFVVLIGFVVLTGLTLAQSKRDFEKAARGSGCDLIPYETLYDSCRSAYGRQGGWCEGEKKKGCGGLSKDKDESEIKLRRDNASECLKYRNEVKQVYDEALDKLGRENQDDLKPFVEEIIKKIKEKQPGHVTATQETENRRNNCIELLK